MQHQQQPSQQSGPKGSITHGTPVNAVGPPIHVQSTTTLSPRFDSILRQTPPNDKLGSITQGTPLHLPSHHLPEKRVYDFYKNNRHSPAQPSQPQQPNSQSSTFGAYNRTAAYALDQQQQLSSRQIIMNDYITSQQMHGQRSGQRPDKESPSPRSSSMAGSPASLYYEKEQQRSRAEYMSRASPAEHTNRWVD